MSYKLTGGAAFPTHSPNPAAQGMTLRDYFAGQAIAAQYNKAISPCANAEFAYEIADAMIAERDE